MAKLFKFTDLQIGNFVSFKLKKNGLNIKYIFCDNQSELSKTKTGKSIHVLKKFQFFVFTDTQIY